MMSEKDSGKEIHYKLVAPGFGFWTVVFVLMAATGNCGMCGFDRDYIGEAVSK